MLSTFTIQEHWRLVLKEPPSKIINHFLNEEMLELAGLFERMNYKFKVPELKSMLKQQNLKVAGNKSELINRLIQEDEKGMEAATKGIELLKCTAQGQSLAEKHLKREKEKRIRTEEQVISALREREFMKACNIVSNYEAKQVFPRGLGINWKNHDSSQEIEALKIIFGNKPALLKGINEECLNQLRIAAGMMRLWGTGSAKTWLPDNIQTGIQLGGDVAAGMLVKYASHQINIREYRSASVNSIEILGANDSDSCPACRKIQGEKYKLTQAPELPYEKCTSEGGWRCVAMVGDF